MSTQTQSPTVECHGPACTATGRKWEFRDGRYCSTECDLRHQGQQTLAALKYDHARCFSCFRALKDINPPKPDFEFTENGHGWTRDADGEPTLEYFDQSVTCDAACGFQYLTGDAGKGEKQRGDRVITGTICQRCGQTSHNDHEPALADAGAIDRLLDLLADEDDIQLDADPRAADDGDTVIDTDALRWAYAVSGDPLLAAGWAQADD